MTTPSASETKHLLHLAERMGIPADEAIRQVARLMADAEPPGVKPQVDEQPVEEPAIDVQPVEEPTIVLTEPSAASSPANV